MRKRNKCPIPPYKSPAYVAGAVEEPSAGYGPGSSAYSPMLITADQSADVGRGLIVEQMDSPEKTTQQRFDIVIPKPPSTEVGGEPGRSEPLGYTVGLLPSRTFRQNFRGATLVRPAMGANPAVGPVGLSNRQGRLQSGVAALVNEWLPSAQTTRELFTQPAARNANPLTSELI